MYRFRENLCLAVLRFSIFALLMLHARHSPPQAIGQTLTAKSISGRSRTSSCYTLFSQCFSASSSFLLFEMAAPNAPSSPPVDLRQRYSVPEHWADPTMYFDPDRLPPLPPIPDAALARQAFRHRSSPLLQPGEPYDRNLNSYEPLEGIGDRLINYAAYKCLRQQFAGATATILGVSSLPFTCRRVPRLNTYTYRMSPGAL